MNGLLYHATYQIYEPSIAKKGLLVNSTKNWTDSKPGVIYLAKTAEAALSYAETAEVSNKIYDSGIIIYRIPTKFLEQSKIFNDTNVRNDDDNETVEYHANIPPGFLQLESLHDA